MFPIPSEQFVKLIELFKKYSENNKDINILNEIALGYTGSFIRYAYRYVTDKYVAQDIVQNAFIYYMSKEDGEEVTPSFFLRTIKFKCSDYNKHKRVVNKRQCQLHDRIPIKLKESDISHSAANIKNILKEVPENLKKIAMYRLNGKKPLKIAEKLGISKYKVYRALKEIDVVILKNINGAI